MDKDTVVKVQQLLLSLGHSPGDIDGICGKKTKAAIDSAYRQYVTDINVGNTGDFWDEIENFDREEFRCKCGGRYCNGFPHEPKEGMVRISQKIRSHFGRPVRVISGLRCETWNRLQGGVDNSQHMYGEACDIRVNGVSGDRLLAYIKTLPGVRYTYLIPGSNNVHFDIPKGAR